MITSAFVGTNQLYLNSSLFCKQICTKFLAKADSCNLFQAMPTKPDYVNCPL